MTTPNGQEKAMECDCRDPDVIVESDHHPKEPLWVVRCRTCGWQGTHEDTKAEAIRKWNNIMSNSLPASGPSGLGEALEQTIDILSGVAKRTRMRGQHKPWWSTVWTYIDEPATSDHAAEAIRRVTVEEILAELNRRAAKAGQEDTPLNMGGERG